MQTHTLTLEVAFPFKSPIPLRYAELMQDLLRQWGNTAELCSLCWQQACKEEEGEQACTGGGRGGGERKREREGERERKQCHSVQEAMLQSSLPRHESTSPATRRLRVSAEKFSSSPSCVRDAVRGSSVGIPSFPLWSYLTCLPSSMTGSSFCRIVYFYYYYYYCRS